MDRAEIIRILRPEVEVRRATEAMAEAIYILEHSEHEYVAAQARKEAMDVELKTKRAETDKEVEQLSRTQGRAFRDMASACDIEKARLAASLSGLKSEIESLSRKKESVESEMSTLVTERNRRVGELDARVRDLEARQAQAEKALDMAAAAAKR